MSETGAGEDSAEDSDPSGRKRLPSFPMPDDASQFMDAEELRASGEDWTSKRRRSMPTPPTPNGMNCTTADTDASETSTTTNSLEPMILTPLSPACEDAAMPMPVKPEDRQPVVPTEPPPPPPTKLVADHKPVRAPRRHDWRGIGTGILAFAFVVGLAWVLVRVFG